MEIRAVLFVSSFIAESGTQLFQDDRFHIRANRKRVMEQREKFFRNRTIVSIAPDHFTDCLAPGSTGEVHFAYPVQRIGFQQFLRIDSEVAGLAVNVVQVEEQEALHWIEQFFEKRALLLDVLFAESKGEILEPNGQFCGVRELLQTISTQSKHFRRALHRERRSAMEISREHKPEVLGDVMKTEAPALIPQPRAPLPGSFFGACGEHGVSHSVSEQTSGLCVFLQ